MHFRKMFYSHVICLGTKIDEEISFSIVEFYSHVICLGTKIQIFWKMSILSFIVT